MLIEQLSVHPFLPRQKGVIMRQKWLNHDRRAFRRVAFLWVLALPRGPGDCASYGEPLTVERR